MESSVFSLSLAGARRQVHHIAGRLKRVAPQAQQSGTPRSGNPEPGTWNQEPREAATWNLESA